ncbi:SGNH/GDSL hydrolase family protein [Companilactobacillus kimchiensis]|uniref:GDSL family lipase n=1 Tax=Companilactobacillus kimchiensis TaxID=993692 RepID=A0A0R2LLR9_9LACO|nr:SGNH/GDSL hydrolase family protein [Companilactobacillus kimchiensis]KRN99895.1 GDSL family lipase [Companilactobacillus kimchiensis]
MITTTTWRHNFTNYDNLENINATGHQHLEILQPLATKKIRLQLNNLYDEIPLKISQLTIFNNQSDKRTVTLNGKSSFCVEPRLIKWSDWIDIDLVANTFLSIDLFSPNKTIHTSGLTISNDLIHTANQDPTIPKYFFGISGIQIETNQPYEKLAFFGDSLTNQGNFSAPLAKNLENNFQIMTANFGISGNRLLHPGNSTSKWSTSFGEAGFTRFDHMMTNYQPNIVIFMEGINDLLHPGTGTPLAELPTAEAVLKAIIILKSKCKKFDTTFIPMTITPADGNLNGGLLGWSAQKENLRQEINRGLLTMPHIIDLSTLVSDKSRLKPEFDCGDHVHFSNNGGKIVAKYIAEQLIRKKII